MLGGNWMEEDYYKVWLSLIKDLGIVRFRNLIKEFKTIKSIYYAEKYKLNNVVGIGKKISENILNNRIKEIAKIHLKYMIKNNIEIVSILDDEYPNILRNIYDPPIFLYLKGNKKILNKMSIAIIGCREARDYGKKIAKNFAYNLSKNNINIISGLAKGIDTCAHLGAIYAKEKTIAVLGSGINVIYPKENLYLVQKILENEGVIISEYPLGTAPEKRNFVARNRIISGMSRGVLVVEAKKKSGTLITVDFALNEGRDIFVIPGDISSENSFGTNDLIKQGGKLVTDFTEILEEYEFK